MHKCKVLSVIVNLLSVAHVIIMTGRLDGRTDGHRDFYLTPPPPQTFVCWDIQIQLIHSAPCYCNMCLLSDSFSF